MDIVLYSNIVCMKIAFFDFDGTITRHDTFIEFAKFSLGKNRLFTAILKNCFHLTIWKLGIISNSKAKQRLFSTLFKGKDYEWFKNCGNKFREIINNDLTPDIINRLRQHKADGHTIVIVSASMPEWICPWANTNGVNAVIATEIEVDNNGLITGEFFSPNCYGEEKVIRIRSMFPNVDEYESWGYGDSVGDNQMLNMVTHAMRVK